MMKFSRFAVASALMACTFGAQAYVSTSVFCSDLQGTEASGAGTVCGRSATNDSWGDTTTTSAKVLAQDGFIKSSARASIQGNGAGFTAISTSVGLFGDIVTIISGASDTQLYVTFARATIDFLVDVDSPENSGGSTHNSLADYRYTFSAFSGIESISASETFIHNRGWRGDYESFDTLTPATLTLPVLSGRSFTFTTELVSDAIVTGLGSAVMDLSNSLYWGGIVSVTDAFGQPVEYFLVSNSGVDWSKAVSAVPEASTYALFSVGLLTIAALRKRRSAIRQ